MKQLSLRVGIAILAAVISVTSDAKPRKPQKSTCDDCNVCRKVVVDVHDKAGAPVGNITLRVGIAPDYNPGSVLWLGEAIPITSPYTYALCLGNPTSAVAVSYELSSNVGSPFVYQRITHTPPPQQDERISITIRTN